MIRKACRGRGLSQRSEIDHEPVDKSLSREFSRRRIRGLSALTPNAGSLRARMTLLIFL